MFADGNYIAILKSMFFNQFAVNVGAIGAAEIFQERIVKDGNDQCMLAADSKIINRNFIFRFASYSNTFLIQFVFTLNDTI